MDSKKLNILALGTKFQSKNEMYRFLTTEVDMHLPPQKECSIYFVRDILDGTKNALYNDEVKVKIVPHIERLRIKDLYWFLENKCDNSLRYLPDDYEKKSISRQWLCNLCNKVSNYILGNTFSQKEFELFISTAVKERQDKFVRKHNMEIETDPRIVKAFENSNFVSTTKGRSHFLLRKSNNQVKQRRSVEENKEEEIKQSQKDEEILYLQKEILDLKDELIKNEEAAAAGDKYAELLNDLFNKGIIDSEGNFVDDA